MTLTQTARCPACDMFVRSVGGGVLWQGDLTPLHAATDTVTNSACPGSGREVKGAPSKRDPAGAPQVGDVLPFVSIPGSMLKVLKIFSVAEGWTLEVEFQGRDGSQETTSMSIWIWWQAVDFVGGFFRNLSMTTAGNSLLWRIGEQGGVVTSLEHLARIVRRIAFENQKPVVREK